MNSTSFCTSMILYSNGLTRYVIFWADYNCFRYVIRFTRFKYILTLTSHAINGIALFQVYTLISNIEFRLRDLSNILRRDQQTERINSRIDVIFNKLSHLEVSNEMWFDKFQQVYKITFWILINVRIFLP
jgi:hypothetical protein